MWSYNQEIEPPAPFIEVIIRHPRLTDRVQRVPAKLDTGADLSAIPQAVADELELLPASTIIAEAYDGSQTSLETYTVIFEFANARFRQVEIILVPDAYALLGRDLLNYFYVHLNGPELTFDLHLSP